MRKILLHEFGPPGVMVVSDQPEPTLADDGYVVEIRAAGINFADIVERRGLYRKDQACPFELGKEASGVIVARGPQAAAFEVGESVIVIKFSGGCYAERVAALPGEILRGPKGHDFEQLAAFAISFAAGWYGMHEIARLEPGAAVLIQAAGGAVGTAAVALARAHSCSPVIGTAGSAAKCAWVEGLGADLCIDYREQDFKQAVLELTGGRGVDYVLESVGGEVFEQSLACLAPLGRIVVIGFSSLVDDYSGGLKRVHPLTLFHRSISIGGLNVENLDFPGDTVVWERIVRHAEEHGLAPRIGSTFALEDAPRAHAQIEARETRGKVLLLP
jgi:NADPH2:quinone reductase